MAPYGNGSLLAARIISSHPTVVAEIDFDSKDGADSVISAFNNMKVCAIICVYFVPDSDNSSG